MLYKRVVFLAALSVPYLPLVSAWVSHCHFRIRTQRVTFDPWDPPDIWSEWCYESETNCQKFFSEFLLGKFCFDKIIFGEKNSGFFSMKNKRVVYCDVRGQFRTIAMFTQRPSQTLFLPDTFCAPFLLSLGKS